MDDLNNMANKIEVFARDYFSQFKNKIPLQDFGDYLGDFHTHKYGNKPMNFVAFGSPWSYDPKMFLEIGWEPNFIYGGKLSLEELGSAVYQFNRPDGDDHVICRFSLKSFKGMSAYKHDPLQISLGWSVSTTDPTSIVRLLDETAPWKMDMAADEHGMNLFGA